MKKSKAFILSWTLVLVFLFAGVFAGCGSSSDSGNGASNGGTTAPATTAKEPAKPVTINVASSQNWTKDIDQKLAEDFKTETGNSINFELSPDDQYPNVLKTKFATGEGPDIFLSQGGTGVVQFQPDANCLDLSSEPWVSRLVDWAKDGGTYNGRLIGFNTWSVDGWSYLYNPDIFQQAGVKVPTNYQEFLEVCEKIKALGVTPIYEYGKAEWHQEVCLNAFAALAAKQSPGLFDQLNKNQAKFADQQILETALAQLKELNDKGYYGKNFMANTFEGAVDAIGTGKYAMCLMYNSFQNEVVAKYPETKADTWEAFPIPLADNRMYATSAGGIYRYVNKNSNVIEGAKEYLNFLSRVENLKAYYEANIGLSVSSFKDYEGETTQAYKSVIANSPDGTGLDFEGGVLYWDQPTIGKLVQELYLGGKTPKQVLEAIDAYRAKMFN